MHVGNPEGVLGLAKGGILISTSMCAHCLVLIRFGLSSSKNSAGHDAHTGIVRPYKHPVR